MPPKNRRSPPPAASRGILSRLLGKLFHLGFVVGIWGGIAVLLYVGYCAIDLPDIHEVVQPPRRPAVTMLADDGSVFARYGDLVGDHVTVKELPAYVPQAIVAIEDRRFYNHFGVDVFGIMRAAVRNLVAGHTVQGGSTLTQQLAKNLFLTPERAMKRKVQEMLLALWMERVYTKDQIMTAYLNRVYLGSGAYGIDAAATTYFNKSANELNIREAAIIAGLLRAPSRYSPMRDPVQAMERAKVVLQAMVEEGYITEGQRKVAVATAPTRGTKQAGVSSDGRYFADWVYDQIGALVQDTAQDMTVKTTLNIRLERAGERAIEDMLAKNGAARDVSEAALVTLAPDGAVKALLGGRDYKTSQFNRATQALRQPGSAFKPFVYLAAIQKGLTPDEILEDAPISIGKYSPQNYENKFRGQVTAREALAESINTVAVRLFERAGAGNVIDAAQSLGITSPMERNAALALGASEVTPLELATAYAAIAGGGVAVTPYAIEEITSRSGQTLYRRSEVNPPQVVEENAVATLVDMMRSVVTTGTGKRAALGSRPVAGKTGTTSDYRDAWFAGFTADYTTVVWMGNDSNAPMKKVSGGSLPTELWHNYMAEAEQGLSERDLFAHRSMLEQAGDAVGAVTDEASKAFGDFINGIVGGGSSAGH